VAHSGDKIAKMEISLWFNAEDNSIRISAPKFPKFFPPVMVSSDPKSNHGHPTLFKRLAKCMAQIGVPAPVIEDEDAPRS